MGRYRVSQVLPFLNGVQRQSASSPCGGILCGACICCNHRYLSRGWRICFPFGIVQLCGRMLCNYRCMRGCPVAATVVCMGKPVFTRDVGPLTRLSPPFLFGLRKFPLRRLICGSTICKCLWCPVLICVYSDAQTVKSHLAILYHSGHCVTTGGIITKNCAPTIIFACDTQRLQQIQAPRRIPPREEEADCL